MKAIVKDVQNYVKLNHEEMTSILEENQNKLNLSGKQKIRWHKNIYVLLNLKM